jgi:DNA-binding PadR family transcriptional regulator
MNQVHGPRNLWELTVLCFLRERPMHPYEMQRLIRQRHKDDFLDLKRGSLYHAIERLQRAGLIEVWETSREGKRPERTVYRLTEQGERERLEWLRELLARPIPETSQFLAAVSYLAQLTPEDARDQLSVRAGRLELELVSLNAIVHELATRLPRVLLLRAEFVRTMQQAELQWVRSLLDEIGSGRLSWDPDTVCRNVRPPPEGGTATSPAEDDRPADC